MRDRKIFHLTEKLTYTDTVNVVIYGEPKTKSSLVKLFSISQVVQCQSNSTLESQSQIHSQKRHMWVPQTIAYGAFDWEFG